MSAFIANQVFAVMKFYLCLTFYSIIQLNKNIYEIWGFGVFGVLGFWVYGFRVQGLGFRI